MKYIVSLGVDNFEFDNGTTAVNFAELAATHFVPTEYNKALKTTVSIETGVVTCMDCKHNDEGFCLEDEKEIRINRTCDRAERW